MAFPRKNRISGKKTFQKIISAGKTVHNSFFFVYYLKNNFKYSRFSVVISSKVVSGAVGRNRIRRRISEVVRKNFVFIHPAGVDIIIIVRHKVKDLNSSELERSLMEIFKKAKVFLKKT